MIPLHLTLRGFLSYLEPVDVDFTCFDLACISGANGAGKSSLLDAITWALFGQARKTDDSVINSHAEDKTAEVTFEFYYEGNTYCVRRSKTRDKATKLEFLILLNTDSSTNPALQTGQGEWKPLTATSIRETQKSIEKTLSMDYETFTNASFFLQGKADQFSQQRPGDRKRILGSILGLDVWEKYRQQAVEKRKDAQEEVAGLDGRLREINSELSEGPARKARLAELEHDLDHLTTARKAKLESVDNLRKLTNALAEQRRQVESLEQSLASMKDKQSRLVEIVTARQNERKIYQEKLEKAAEIEASYQSWLSARQAIERWEAVATQFRQQQDRRQGPLMTIEAERGRLNQEWQTLGAQEKNVNELQKHIDGLTHRLEAARLAIESATRQLARRDEVMVEKDLLLSAQAQAKAENPRLKSEMEELKERIDTLELTTSPVCPLCGQPLSAEHRRDLLADLKNQGKQLGERFRENLAVLKKFETNQRDLDKELADLSSAEPELRQQNRNADQVSDQLKGIDQIVQDWLEKGKPRFIEITRQLRENDFANEAQADLASIDAGLKAIGYDAQAHDLARQDELNGRDTETRLRELENARAALAPLERELANLKEQLSAQEDETNQHELAYHQAVEAYNQAAENVPDFNQAERELFEIQEKENRLRMEVGAAIQKVDVLANLLVRQKSLGEEREDKSRLISRLRTLERAFSKDGVPALLIEQALPEIERQANQILERLSGGNMSVRFVTQKEFKDKNRDDLKETLEIQISDGAGARDYEMFSGGEAFRVNFAIRLALSRVLAQRAGARLQTLVIDEGFGSQDAQGRQRLIEAINLVHKDFKKILVITHLDELKEVFPYRLEVEKTPHGSIVRGF